MYSGSLTLLKFTPQKEENARKQAKELQAVKTGEKEIHRDRTDVVLMAYLPKDICVS